MMKFASLLPHEILGVRKNASEEEIRKAFRKAARKHHPDKTTGDNEMMQMLNKAYNELLQISKPGMCCSLTQNSEWEMISALFGMLSGDGFKNPIVGLSKKFAFYF